MELEEYVTNFLPIILIITGGRKEIFIIKRSNYHIFTHNDITKKQQCFTVLKSTIFTAMMDKIL